ncbi:cupin domain-containing protein [Gilvimarinus algae]|uniref:Cupin domain-containing protein n=1 Tax=Gilvimarinus algae TaxID=3058037 RepID=A0ABT8TI27_9GAMM|nr:cupin domain-containing protein [Gilvimarinus sp. SDUM040014]MDO3383750.1 cupin domain-containing protein [Gilvimarinus sp. SDUM040014]
MTSPHSIEKQFVVISPDKVASVERADTTLYERLDANYSDFVGHELVSCYEFDSDWPSWEVHPHGDEVVLLLSGDVTFVLQTDSGEHCVNLNKQGQYVLVPRGVWHTARTNTASKLLFVTPGQGTQHRGV